ncbi:MAG: tail fiber protein [Bacteroidales bacterium]|nr:tail fiber protein [Bacteroidales bacterium]
MKKTLFTVACALFALGLSAQQWNQLGDYKIEGKVGIGVPLPKTKLDVRGCISSTGSQSQRGGLVGSLNFYNIYSSNPPVATICVKNNTLGVNPHERANIIFSTWNGDTIGITERMRIASNGNVGIGTTDPGSYKLAVEGKIGAREVVVTTAAWADFVFDSNYDLMSLSELDAFIKENKHLPEIPTTNEVKEQGVSVGEMNAKLLQKIEELTLHTIKQQELIEKLTKRMDNLENK